MISTIFDREKHTINMRPTLIIGTGGTGYETAVRIKARFQETYPDAALDQIKFIVFDTDTNHTPVVNSIGELVRLTPEQELVQIGGVPVGGIINNEENYPAIHSEFDLSRLPKLDLTKGAKQVRQLGRLAFFYHFQRIRNIVETALNAVLNISHRGEVGKVQAINVYYISSVCGGTGSGMIIDLAYLVRHLAKINGIPEDNIFGTAALVLPEAFKKVPRSSHAQIRANASATLEEIDHFSVYNDFNVLYPDSVRIRDKRPPFNIAYLIDAINENNQTVEDMTQLAPILAEALFLQAGTHLGGGLDSAFDNVASARGDDLSGFTRTYSMIGASTLRFNAARMRQACALRLMTNLVRDLFTKPLPEHRVELDPEENAIHPLMRDEVASYLSSAKCTNASIINDQLIKMPNSRNMVVSINTEKHAKEEVQAIVGLTEKTAQKYAQRTVNGEFANRLASNQALLSENATERLSDVTYQLCDQAESGVIKAQQFLEGIIYALAPIRKELRNKQSGAESMKTRTTQDVIRSRDLFDEAAQKFTFWGLNRRPLTKARRAFTDAYRRDLNIVLDMLIVGQSFAVLDSIEAKARQLLGSVSTLRTELERSAADASYELESLRKNWTTAYVTEENVDSVDAIPHFYDRYLNSSLQNEATTLLESKQLSAWLHEIESPPLDPFIAKVNTGDEIARWLYDYVIKSYDQIIEKETIEKQIKDLYPNQPDQEARLLKLVTLAAPFSNYVPALAGQGSEDLDPILVVGVTEKDRSTFRDTSIRRGSYVSTFDEHRISVLHTKHGLPLYALRQYGEYKKFYARLSGRSGIASYLCFNNVKQAATGRTLFMRAEVFGLISQQGVMGYYMQHDGEEVLLGDSLKQTIETVIGRLDLQHTLKTQVDQQLRQTDLHPLLNLLNSYMEAPNRSPRPLSDELKLLAQSDYERYHARSVV